MKITEENFIKQLKLGNERALEFIINQYGWVIKTVAKKYLYKKDDLLDECLNDVLLAVWENIDTFDINKNSFKNWLAGVSRYKAIDCKRKYLKNVKEESLEKAEDIEDTQSSYILLKQEILENMEEMLSCLSSNDRRIFEKLFWKGESVKSISKSMDMKESAIYNHVSRGKKKLRDHLTATGRGNNL
ncbi:sigma-70 family RNA polymerase sigma factor [Anaerovorax odorimutans]|uniref:sigma-70 family RNA polymerase sigma factor n=1 Tax=Anaerovorax odorimutans TaxID=109327 RepID=UPI000418D61F|nr:sigma-70 family RNA polymerase sigma factor [Anaerovorax odorimutans]